MCQQRRTALVQDVALWNTVECLGQDEYRFLRNRSILQPIVEKTVWDLFACNPACWSPRQQQQQRARVCYLKECELSMTYNQRWPQWEIWERSRAEQPDLHLLDETIPLSRSEYAADSGLWRPARAHSRTHTASRLPSQLTSRAQAWTWGRTAGWKYTNISWDKPLYPSVAWGAANESTSVYYQLSSQQQKTQLVWLNCH